MNISLWNRRIPTLFGIFLIIIGIAITSYLTQTGAIPFLRAAPTDNPENLRVTNITDTSFSVTYTTQTAVLGSIVLGKNAQEITSGGQVVFDDRDQQSGIPSPHIVHSITVRNLQAKTQYFYSITSGKTRYLNNNDPFTITTGDIISTAPSQQQPLTGSVLLPDGTKPQEALLYVTTDNGQTISVLVKPDGIYIIPLNTMRNASLTAYLSFQQTTKLQFLITNGDLQSEVVISANQNNPVPPITLSSDYDFSIDSNPLASSSALPIGFPVFSLDTKVKVEPQINIPSQNEKFVDSQPNFTGKALPNEAVSISIHSSNATITTVTADSFGNWSYRPSSPLTPGTHTITITTKDQFGILKTIQQTFTIFQSGTQVAEAATPSASPTIQLATPTPTILLKISPTIPLVKTPTVTLIPTLTLIPTRIPTLFPSISALPSPAKKIPPTGNNSAITIGVFGVTTTIVGIVLFLITHATTL
jgi:hypothetical protein